MTLNVTLRFLDEESFMSTRNLRIDSPSDFCAFVSSSAIVVKVFPLFLSEGKIGKNFKGWLKKSSKDQNVQFNSTLTAGTQSQVPGCRLLLTAG